MQNVFRLSKDCYLEHSESIGLTLCYTEHSSDHWHQDSETEVDVDFDTLSELIGWLSKRYPALSLEAAP